MQPKFYIVFFSLTLLLVSGTLSAQCRMEPQGSEGQSGMVDSGLDSATPSDTYPYNQGTEGSAGALYPWEFDTTSVTTMRGSIISIDTMLLNDTNKIISAIIRTDLGDSLQVILAPPSYLNWAGVFLNPNDSIRVTGSRIEYDGAPVLIASIVYDRNTSVLLRDGNGNPLWQKQEEIPSLQ